MKHSYILAALIVGLVWGPKLYAGATETEPSDSQPAIKLSVSQKLQSLKMSNEDYARHKLAISILVEEGYETLAERYFRQEVLGEPVKTAKNQEHNEHNESP